MTPWTQKITENRRVRLYHEVLCSYEAGIILEGWEVKSVRSLLVSITDSYVLIINNVPLLVGAIITPVSDFHGALDSLKVRRRKLLLHKKEITQIHRLVKQRGLTAILGALYFRGKHIKCEILVVKKRKRLERPGESAVNGHLFFNLCLFLK